MTIKDSVKLMELYAVCPKCSCETIGNGTGTLECDTAAGYFKRTCGCGWYVEVQEGVAEKICLHKVSACRPDGFCSCEERKDGDGNG